VGLRVLLSEGRTPGSTAGWGQPPENRRREPPGPDARGRIGDVTTDEQALPGSEAMRGVELIETRFSDGREATDIQPVFRHPTLRVGDPAYRVAVTASLERAAAVVPGTRVVSYFSSGSDDLVGQDGHMPFATQTMVTDGAVEKHVSNIFGKLGLTTSEGAHRRVLAVLAFLRSG
jgi:hypothetical protein